MYARRRARITAHAPNVHRSWVHSRPRVATAAATSAPALQIRLKEYGAELLEVADNGSGIAPADFATVAAKHHTSKIAAFADVASAETFGFRGEALSSLCAVASVSVATRAAEQELGSRLTFDQRGRLAGVLCGACTSATSACSVQLTAHVRCRIARRVQQRRDVGCTAE